MKIATHDGIFHADDVFAVATLTLLPGMADAEIIRTRDEAKLSTASFRVDVGGEYFPTQRRFDHHQGVARQRDPKSGFSHVPYASFGLVWLEYGELICRDYQLALPDELPDELKTPIHERIESSLVVGIDAADNGIFPKTPCVTISQLISLMNGEMSGARDAEFKAAVEFARGVLWRALRREQHERYHIAEVWQACLRAATQRGALSRVLSLDEFRPWIHVVRRGGPRVADILYAVFPADDGSWRVQAVPSETKGAVKISLPSSWILQPPPISTFVHRNLFICGAASKEDALRLAEIAVEDALRRVASAE